MKRIIIKLNQSDSCGIFHDTRKDVRTLMKVVNVLIDKINELVEENNKLNKEPDDQRSVATKADQGTERL